MPRCTCDWCAAQPWDPTNTIIAAACLLPILLLAAVAWGVQALFA